MEITNCNQCPNQCPADDLKCGRGRRYFEQLENPDATKEDSGLYGGGHGHGDDHGHGSHGEGHESHGHGDGHGEGHGGHDHGHSPHGRPDDLYGLMRACGHYLHHNGGEGETLFAALDNAEQESLKGMLKKLVDSWEQ